MSAKITFVGPIAPFRGGIAQHSTALAKAFADRLHADIQVESFASLYPRMLYPGVSDRDDTLDTQLHFLSRYTLSSVNPLTWWRAAKRIAERAGGIVIMPSWTFFVAPALGWMARRLRRHGIVVVMIVHNATDHEESGWKSRLLNWQLAAADGFVTHTEDLARQLRTAGHVQPVAVTSHPAYSDFPPPRGTLPRKRALELLCFGLVRRYKGVDIALRALRDAGLSNVRLTIAGEGWDDAAEIRALADSTDMRGRVEIVDRFVSNAEAAELFARCDAVLATYRSVTGSGVVALAQHYRRPVVAPDLPGFMETIDDGRTGWLYSSGNESILVQLLRDSVTRESAAAMLPNIEQAATRSSWEGYSQSILELADRIVRSKEDNA